MPAKIKKPVITASSASVAWRPSRYVTIAPKSADEIALDRNTANTISHGMLLPKSHTPRPSSAAEKNSMARMLLSR